MTTYKFLWGYTPETIVAETPRNAVLKFLEKFKLHTFDIWYVMPSENVFIVFANYRINKDSRALYYDCDVKPIY